MNTYDEFSSISLTGELPDQGDMTDQAYIHTLAALYLVDILLRQQGHLPPDIATYNKGLAELCIFFGADDPKDLMYKIEEQLPPSTSDHGNRRWNIID